MGFWVCPVLEQGLNRCRNGENAKLEIEMLTFEHLELQLQDLDVDGVV